MNNKKRKAQKYRERGKRRQNRRYLNNELEIYHKHKSPIEQYYKVKNTYLSKESYYTPTIKKLIKIITILKYVSKKINIKNLIPRFNSNLNILLDLFEKYGLYFFSYSHFSDYFQSLPNKSLFIEKKNKILRFYLPLTAYKHEQIISFILFVKNIDKISPLSNFKLKQINTKFYPRYAKFYYSILGTCYKENYCDKAFLSYYIYAPYLSSSNFNGLNTEESIELVMKKSKCEPKYNKLFWRGSINNIFRERLKKLKGEYLDVSGNYVNFIDFMNYKYILDIWGISEKHKYLPDGHSGRRFWYFLMNRVIFIPINDPCKLFFEIGENKIKPNIHYVPYSPHKLDELNDKIHFFENNPDEYKRIKDNCRIYRDKYLKYSDIKKFVKNSLKSL